MAGTLIQSEFVFRSGTPPSAYQFTIVSNELRRLLVRDIQDPYGFVISPYTQVPRSVMDDIATAMGTVETILTITSTVSGSLNFVAETEKSVVFVTPFSTTDYQICLTSDVPTVFTITNKTKTGFTVRAAATITGVVGYDVMA